MGERRARGGALGIPAVAAPGARLVLAAALLLASTGLAAAEPLRLEVGRVGEVLAPEAGPPEPPRPGNVVGSTPVSTPRFVHLGTDVVGVYCKQFGLEFRALNLPPDGEAPVTIRLDHPLWRLPDGRTSTAETNLGGVVSDHWAYTGYTLEEPWALVPGAWTFTISQGPRVLAVTSFNVSVEMGQAEPQDGCTTPTS